MSCLSLLQRRSGRIDFAGCRNIHVQRDGVPHKTAFADDSYQGRKRWWDIFLKAAPYFQARFFFAAKNALSAKAGILNGGNTTERQRNQGCIAIGKSGMFLSEFGVFPLAPVVDSYYSTMSISI